MSEPRFANKVAIVTGASSGIGKGTALRLAREGAAVCVVANRNVEGGEATVRELRDLGVSACFVQADVSRQEDCEAVVAQAAAELGPVRVLVNNAGITRTASLQDGDLAFWDTVMDTNLKSAYLMTRLCVPGMVEAGGGSVVNVSSVHAVATHAGHAAYAASKAGMLGMSRALAIELGRKGVRVNCVLPGTIDISLYSRRNVEVDREQWVPHPSDIQVMGRLGSPDEIAAAICFLAADEASFVNGAVLAADGALTAILKDR